MAFNPTQLENDLSVYGTIVSFAYNNESVIVVMSSVQNMDLSSILNVFNIDVSAYYPICVSFSFTEGGLLKVQYAIQLPNPPASDDSASANP